MSTQFLTTQIFLGDLKALIQFFPRTFPQNVTNVIRNVSHQNKFSKYIPRRLPYFAVPRRKSDQNI